MKLGIWEIVNNSPKGVSGSGIGLESYLEDWIENDPTLISEGLEIVGRQITLSGKRLDLLGISPEDRWVVIELKAGSLYKESLVQALEYAAILNETPNDVLKKRLKNLGDSTQELVNELLDNDEPERDIEIIIVGVGVDIRLERLSGYLSEGFGLPIRIVTFDVFELLDDRKLLIREVTEQPVSKEERRTYSVEAVELLASKRGSLELLKLAIQKAEDLDLYIHPWKNSLTFNAQSHRSHTLVYVRPKSGNKLKVGYKSHNFANIFPVTETEVVESLGSNNWETFGVEKVKQFLENLERLFSRLSEPIS